MANGDPILLGLAGATFLLSQETGGRIQSFERSTSSKTLDVYNAALGGTDGTIFHDPMADYSVEIITIRSAGAAAGIALLGPGLLATLANITTGNGVTADGVYCLTTRLNHAGENLERFSMTARQRPFIS